MGTILLLIILLFPPGLLLLARKYIKRERFQKAKKIVGILFLLFICLFIAAMKMENYNFYFRGYRSTSIIFIIMSVLGFLFCILYPASNRLTLLPVLLYIGVIAVTIMSVALTIEMVDDYKSQLYYTDSKYRVEETNRGFMAPCGLPSLFVKKGLLERRYELEDSVYYGCLGKREIQSVSITEFPDNVVLVTIHHTADTSWHIPNPLVRIVSVK